MDGAGRRVKLAIRPENVRVSMSTNGGSAIASSIYVTEPIGEDMILEVRIGTGERFVVKRRVGFEGSIDETAYLEFNEHKIRIFDREPGVALV